MENNTTFDVIIIGGSYSGLSAAMSLARALRKVLIIDSGKPCNRQTPHSHNFLTQDGTAPAEIARKGKEELLKYPTVRWLNDLVIQTSKAENGFRVETAAGTYFSAKRLHLATGIRDIMPDIDGFAECWGISALHCPFCHGYEVRALPTAFLGNGETAFRMAGMLNNWTKDLSILTNGTPSLTDEQVDFMERKGVRLISKEIRSLDHRNGRLQAVRFHDGSTVALRALYAHLPFELHSPVSRQLGCALTEEGLVEVDEMQQTSIPGVSASGDCTSRMRSVALAVAEGNKAGGAIVHGLVAEEF